jgi:CubicO group peptidase (beta-lactamase class C family)
MTGTRRPFMRHVFYILPAIALSGTTLLSQAQPAPRPAQPARPAAAAPARDTTRAGFSVQRLERIDALLQQYVDENRIGGAAALVLRDG